ncbi:MAG: N-acetyltransferase [Gemmatimonadetes bacterium]|nr:N-acetyltransferase [Gemmatimonadota bacterium]
MVGVDSVTLEGRVVRLEPLTLGHVEALAAVGLDPDLWRWTNALVRTADDMRRYVETALQWQKDGTALPFATVLRSENRVIGSTRFGNMDAANRRAEIGWTWIGRPWQRSAVNSEAKYLMLRHAFEIMNCIRVELKTDVLNAQSRAAIERIGGKEEGTLRSHMITESGRVRDTVYYSIIESEWPAVKRELEAGW